MDKNFIICFSKEKEKLLKLVGNCKNFLGTSVNLADFHDEIVMKQFVENINSKIIEFFIIDFNEDDTNMLNLIEDLNRKCPNSIKLLISDSKQLLTLKNKIKNTSTLQYLVNNWSESDFNLSLQIVSEYYQKINNPADLKKASENIESIEERITKQLQHLLDSNLTKDKFNAIIAHDLKNSFSVLLGLSEILVNDWNDIENEAKFEIVNDFQKTTKSTYELLENLLNWSKSQKDKIVSTPSLVKIQHVVDSAIKITEYNSHHKKISIKNGINEGLKVNTDENMISTVFRNLISNAVKYTPAGGRVDISAKEEKDSLTFCVADNGGGIDKPYILELFKLETKNNSTYNSNNPNGLGLFLCKEFVELNGGKIWLETKKGEGSKFYFSVPA